MSLSVIMGIAIVAVALLVNGLGREEGWPIVRFVAPANETLVLVGQCVFGLLAAIIGVSYGRRAMRQWNGDISGGRAGAVFNAVACGGLFFAAVELVRAGWQ